jgi:hypothetical protein
MPDFFDLVDVDARHFRERELGKAKRGADAQSAGQKFDQRDAG